MFDPSEMNSPKMGQIYINNEIKLRPWQFDFGTGNACFAIPAELKDMVKIWRPAHDTPVNIIFGGFAAKVMRG